MRHHPTTTNPPLVASGVRIGTPALTSREMREPEMDLVGSLIAEVLRAPEDAAVQAAVRGRVRELAERFPLYDALM
jgi:glycine hydroxymethyltransferase